MKGLYCWIFPCILWNTGVQIQLLHTKSWAQGWRNTPKNQLFNNSIWGIKKARCQEEKTAKCNTTIRQLPNLLPPLSPQHDINDEKEEEGSPAQPTTKQKQSQKTPSPARAF
jgi:hypothetical protein